MAGIQALGYTRANFLAGFLTDMNEFVVGQRWLSDTETDLGLGIVQESDYRLVKVYFPGAEQERVYAKDNAPLSRIHFHEGDGIELIDGTTYIVNAVDEVKGLLFYRVCINEQTQEFTAIPEAQLGAVLKLKQAEDRLASRQIDSPRWFELRYFALAAQQKIQSRSVTGLTGARVDLIPHQLYIAHEVARRYAPRVLLADEVGLGKTIEAGLIVHQQLLTHRASRVLIVVPKSLTHQWFVEMYRRFNLHFSIFDQQRINETVGSSTDNAFSSQQLILCSRDFLFSEQAQSILEVDWDLLVVDEAHHLDWQEHEVSPEYAKIEQIAARSKGLLLLTATPEQLGQEGHFGRLRLLDPERFSSLADFLAQQNKFRKLADLIALLGKQEKPDDKTRRQLVDYLSADEIASMSSSQIISALLDCYGTGRVLFRNTRKNIQGFPKRKVFPYALEAQKTADAGNVDLLMRLYPESASTDDSWCSSDVRVTWLLDFCKQHSKEKILLICALKNTAMDLELFLRYRKGFKTAVFHEDMDLLSRDRAAAYFADHDDGAQILVCSEIGSEGRNFQFSSNLVLFDLPLIPDLLEQRIGRLDRIGQKNEIHLHVPFVEGSAQSLLFDWYHHGINAFEQTNPAGEAIYLDCESLLLDALASPENQQLKENLLQHTRDLTEKLKNSLEQGRDRLLELASYNDSEAKRIVAAVAEEQGHTPYEFMEEVFDCFGVNSEEHSPSCSVLHPSDHMFMGDFPYLPEDGLTVTYDRNIALRREDMAFLSWEHPMCMAAIELVLSLEKGKACVALLKNRAVKPGTLLIELLFKVETIAPKHLQATRFLPTSMIRLLLDGQGRNLSASVSHENINKQVHKLPKSVGRKMLGSEQQQIQGLLKKAKQVAEQQAQLIKNTAIDSMTSLLDQELERLTLLQSRNAGIRKEELDYLRERKAQLTSYLAEAPCQLDAVRVLVTTNQ